MKSLANEQLVNRYLVTKDDQALEELVKRYLPTPTPNQ